MPVLIVLWNIAWVIALVLMVSAGLIALLLLNVGALTVLRMAWQDFRRGK